MPALKDPRHERFAQSIAAGTPGAEAYVGAGYADNKQARSAASRLGKNKFVARRIVELNKAVTTRAQRIAVMDKAKVLEELQISMLEARKDKQHSASVRALELLGKEQKMFVDRKDVTMHSIEDIPDDVLKQLLDSADQRDQREESIQ